MQWVDTHAHLDHGKYEDEQEAVIDRAREAGVWPIVTVGADLASSRAAVALAERTEGLYATVGVHPHEASSVDAGGMAALRELARHPRVVAVGEIGLDYFYEFSPRDAQRAAFEGQLALASEVGKPVVVHLRDKRGERGVYALAAQVLGEWAAAGGRSGHGDALTRAEAGAPGVLHCFSGSLEIGLEMIEAGFYLGVDGPVTYPNARALQAIVAELPLERLVLETDCPYLAPQARRGRRNEPAYLPWIGEKVAELQGVGVARVARVTSANAARLFGLGG
jgi:TatD DNase family protein